MHVTEILNCVSGILCYTEPERGNHRKGKGKRGNVTISVFDWRCELGGLWGEIHFTETVEMDFGEKVLLLDRSEFHQYVG